MSEMEDKIRNDEEITRMKQDGGSVNSDTISEGKVLTLDSNKETEIISAISENMPQSAAIGGILHENTIKTGKIESELPETTKEFTNTDAGKGVGDYTTQVKVSDMEINNTNIAIDLNKAKSSKTDVIAEKDESNDSSLDKCDEPEFNKADDEDEDMELRWDDDDGSSQVAGDDSGNSDVKKDNVLSEDQLLEESSDVIITKPTSEMDSDENSKGLILNDNIEDNPSEDQNSKEFKIGPKLDIPTKTDKDKNTENILEDELLIDDNEDTETVNSPKMDITADGSVYQGVINIAEDKLLQINTKGKEIPIEISMEKNNDEPLKEIDETGLLENEITVDKEAKEDLDDIIEEDKLLAESESDTEMETATLKLTSSADIILNKDKDDVIIDKNLLEKADSNIETSGITLEKEVPIPVNKDLDENDDVLLEEKLLEETETAEVIPETDATVEVDDEKAGELLKDENSQYDSCSLMDVDNIHQVEEDQPMIDKITDQPMDGVSEVENKNINLPIDHQTNIEKVNIDKKTVEIKDMDQYDDQASSIKATEKNIDQPIEDLAKIVDIDKDTHIEANIKDIDRSHDQAKTTEKITAKPTIDKDIPIEDESKMKETTDQAKSEKENTKQPTDDENEEESNTTEKSNNSPLQTDAVTVTNTSNILIEDLEKSITEDTTPEKDVNNKIEPEIPEVTTESVNKDNKLVETDEISANDSSFLRSCLEDSPVGVKTDHGLNKPDVMLEIPSQELINMDDTDLSMNLDQSDIIDNPNDVVKNVNDDTEENKTVDIEHEKTVDRIIPDSVTVSVKTVNQEAIVSEAAVGEIQKDSDFVESNGDKRVVDTVEENMQRMFADDEPEVVKEIAESIAPTQNQQTDTVPSTSITRMTPDTSDEVPEISDSLGLLAESAGRMMEDDEEPDDDDDADEDDDFDQDESSNQISAEQSEDSNPAALEIEPVEDQEDKDIETPDPKDEEFPFMICDSSSQDKVEKMDVEVEEYGTIQLQAQSLKDITEETKSAVNALLQDSASNEHEPSQKTTKQMDIETVKLSDTSDNEVDIEPTEVQQAVAEPSKEVEDQQKKQSPSKSPSKSNQSLNQSPSKQLSNQKSPSKMKMLAITTQEASSVVNIVDLEESSSSEDDIQEVEKQPEPDTTPVDNPPSPESDVTNVNIPTGIEIMCTSGGSTSEIVTKEGEMVISGVPKPPPHKPARLNTSEVSIKTVSSAEPMIIPVTKINEQNKTQNGTQSQPKLSLEIFSLDSDDEEIASKEKSPTTSPHEITTLELEKTRETNKCINYCCTSDNKVTYKIAEPSEIAYYDAGRKRRSMVCQPCADVVADRTKNLIQGIKDMTPLLDLEMGKLSQDLVEISDSESEDEDMTSQEPKESIGEKGAKFIEENLAKYLNDTWRKYEMDVRLKETQIMLDDEINKLEQDSKEIDAMLNECQIATDKLRCELYATFECRRQELPSLVVYDTPESKYIGLENELNPPPAPEITEIRQAKRRLSSTSETPAKRPAIPLGYAPLDGGDSKDKAVIPGPDTKIDDDKDISVVKLSAEAAPAELPPPGEISRPPLRVSMPVYAMKNAFGPWLKGRVLEIQPKNQNAGNTFSLCRVKFDHKTKTNGKVLAARCIAYSEPADVRMTIGTRLIALFKDSNKRESYYSGVVAEIPNPVNNYRYLVFFDDGYAQYVQHQYTRLVCESSPLVWEEVHPFSREFVREYLLAYPERPMVRLHEGQHLKTEWNGKWWSSRVTRVDASLAQVLFVGDGRREWIYRGSTRLAPLYLELRAAERHRPRPMPRSKAQPRFNMPYVEYTRWDEQESTKQAEPQAQQQQQQQQSEDIRRQRAVAKKSTSAPVPVQHPAPPPHQQMPNTLDSVTSRVVYYTPKNAVKPLKMIPHRCSPKCKRSDVLSLRELRTYNPLAKPLLSGWERQIVRFKGHKDVMYRAPCGRRLRNMRELHHYLRSIDSDLPVDLFDFHYSTHCLAEFVLNKCLVGKKDLSHGKENVPVPCVNYYDDSLPEFCSYNTERTPTAGVPLNLEPEFLCGCDCTDDCQDKSKCACWKMTLEGARTIGLNGPNVGYVYKRLPEPLPSGIYECNSRCKCKHTCLNRVAQHPLQLKLQVFKTPNRGWGIRALNDVPKGSFLCVYAGNLLTDATANLDGLNEGDEYLAELDYIEVVEQMKEGYEEDIPEADKKLDKKEQGKENDDSEEDEPSSSEEEETASKTDKEDDDFRPGYIGLGVTEFNKRLRKREKSKKDKEKSATDEKEKEKDTTKDKKESNAEEDCITISDDEEVREPSRFMVQAGMGANEFISKYKSVRTLFGKDEACYIMDAKVQGNIGRYLNHSCCPNVFVQNVFVDTHDPRFPWVAFFALSHIKAGTELTWNYNYDVGSVPGKILYCYCGTPNCRGRLL